MASNPKVFFAYLFVFKFSRVSYFLFILGREHHQVPYIMGNSKITQTPLIRN